MQARCLLGLLLCSILPLLAHSSPIVVPNGQIISDVLLTANNGDIVSVVSGTYPSEYAFTITKNITIIFQGPATIGLTTASPFWLNVTSNVTLAGAEVTFTSCGITLAAGALLSQTADMKMTNVATYAVAVGDGATWTQSGGLSVTHGSNFDQDPALISLGVEARWEQAGPLTIDSTGATGVSVGSSSSWSQSGPVLIDVSSVVVSPPFSLPPKVCATAPGIALWVVCRSSHVAKMCTACFCRTRPAGSRTSHSTSTSPTRHPASGSIMEARGNKTVF